VSEKLEIIIVSKDQASGDLRKVKGSLGGLESALGKGLKVAAAGAAAGLLAVGAAAVFSVSQAGAATEMLSKYNVVFGRFAEDTTASLALMSEETGRSKYALMEMAAGVQDLFVPLGFARGEAAGLSVDLAQLAVDVGSFNNEMAPDVMNAFQSALVGNHEAVRRFGIVITQTTLDAELLRMGIEGGVAAATDQEKVLARLNLIYAGSADAIGDAARTSGSWANQLVALKSVLGDTATDIGMTLLPVLTPFLQQVTGLAVEMSKLAADILPVLQERLEGLAEVMSRSGFWDWLADEQTIGAKAEEAATFLAEALAAWADDPGTGAQMEKLGEAVGQGIVRGIVAILSPGSPEMKSTELEIIKGIWSMGRNILLGIRQFSVELGVGIVTGIIEGFLSLIGVEMPQAIKDGIRAGIENAATALSFDFVTLGEDFVKALVEGWEAATEEIDWAGIGASIVEGVQEGVLGKIPDLIAAFEGGLKRVLEAGWKVIRGTSPSKLFAKIGVSISQGVAMGIRDAAHEVNEAGHFILFEAFRKWFNYFKVTLPGFRGKIHGAFKDYIRDVLKDFTATGATTMAEATSQIFDQMVAKMARSGGNLATAAAQMAGQKQMLIGLLGGGVATTYGSLVNKAADYMTAAGVFGGLGGTAASLVEQRRLGPLREHIRMMEEEFALMEEQGSSLKNMAIFAEMLNRKRAEARSIEQDMAALAKQQADLQFLQQQSNLIQMIKEHGLNAKNILGGLKLGLDADLQGLIQAMTRAMQQMIGAAEAELGIASHSKKGFALGQNFIEAMGIGALEAVPATAMAVGGAAGQVTNVTKNYYFEPHYSTRQSPSSLMHDVRVLQMLEA